MSLSLPFEVCYILHLLNKNAFSCFLVGGAVRDLVMHVQPELIKDYDFTSDANPLEIQSIFKDSFYENKFGTVSLTHESLMALMSQNYQLPSENLSHLIIKKDKPSNRIIDLKKAKKILFKRVRLLRIKQKWINKTI